MPNIKLSEEGPTVTVTVEIPQRWVDMLEAERMHPNDPDTLEQRVYYAIMEQIDRMAYPAPFFTRRTKPSAS